MTSVVQWGWGDKACQLLHARCQFPASPQTEQSLSRQARLKRENSFWLQNNLKMFANFLIWLGWDWQKFDATKSYLLLIQFYQLMLLLWKGAFNLNNACHNSQNVPIQCSIKCSLNTSWRKVCLIWCYHIHQHRFSESIKSDFDLKSEQLLLFLIAYWKESSFFAGLILVSTLLSHPVMATVFVWFFAIAQFVDSSLNKMEDIFPWKMKVKV